MFVDAPRCLDHILFRRSTAYLLLALLFCIPLPLPATESAEQDFDIPADEAVSALRLFATQSRRQVISSGAAVANLRTATVKGRFTAHLALVQMVAHTGLIVSEDPKTGALAITANRRPPAHPDPPKSSSSNETPPHTTMKSLTLSGAIAALLTVTPASAQTQRPAVTDPKSDEIIQLSVFQVQSSREHGYRAAGSVTATGIGTEIANIPVNVGVVTQDFIQDWGGVELRDATKGVSGFNSDSQNSNRVWLRGFESSRILQDGFEIGFGMMTDGVDRIEIIKGPSAIFHGEVNPAGVVNLISARPTWQHRHQVRLSYGSFDHHRAYFQTSGPLIGGKLAYMAFASYTKEGGWADHMMRRIKIAGGALTWQPLPKLKFTLDARRTEKERIESALLPFSHPAFVAAVQAGQVAPLTTARAWLNANPLYGPNVGQNAILVDHLVFKDREQNPFNRNYPQIENRQTVQAEMTYAHSKAVNFRLAAFDNEADRTSGFYTSFRPVAGYNRNLIFAAAEHRFNYGFSDQARSGLKADLNLNFSLLGIHHAMLVGYEHGKRKSGASNINTVATVYNPRTDPDRDALAELRARNPNWFPPIAEYGRLASDSYYVANQMSVLDGRLRLLAGARRMDLEVYSPGATAGSGRTNQQSKTTPQAGLLFRPSDLGAFYVNYSESFESQLVVDALGGVSGPITGDGIEAGLKTDWMDGRISGTLGVYRIERANIARRDTPRERELNITPLWIMGGVQRTEGLDLDVTWSPQPNLQFVFTYANMWFAETVADQQTPQQIGVRLRHTPEHALGLFGKYTFTEGALKGFYVGASGLYRSTFNFHDSWDVPATVDNFRQIDLLFGYRRSLRDGREMTVSVNINNVTNERFLDFQYLWNEPVNARLNIDFRF